jgi:hypothetical protein
MRVVGDGDGGQIVSWASSTGGSGDSEDVIRSSNQNHTNDGRCAKTSISRVIRYRDRIELEVEKPCEASPDYVSSLSEQSRDCSDQSQKMAVEIWSAFHLSLAIALVEW